MRRNKVSLLFSFPLFLLVVAWLVPAVAHGEGEDAAKEKILAVFHSYRQGPAQVSGITPGMTIDKSNWEAAKEVLPPEILKYLEAGDFAITVQETTDMPLRQEYVEATLQNYGKASLGEGELKNYMAGRPFPLIDSQDSQAGLKAAWNHRYRDRGETVEMWPTVELRNSSGAIERTLSFYFTHIYGMHRLNAAENLPESEKEGVFLKQYIRFLAPSDLEGNQLLSYIYDKDTLTNDRWIYDAQTRRVRKVVDNPYEAFQGQEFISEDIQGFNGYLHSYEWKYLGEEVVLAPGPVKTAEPTWGGRGNWYPVDPWELRKAIVIEARPKGPHPVYSRRVLYLDVQIYETLYSLTYDHEGNHKRTFFLVYWHPDFNPGENNVWLPQTATQSSIDYQRERASIYQGHKATYNQPLEEKRFKTGALMRYGK